MAGTHRGRSFIHAAKSILYWIELRIIIAVLFIVWVYTFLIVRCCY